MTAGAAHPGRLHLPAICLLAAAAVATSTFAVPPLLAGDSSQLQTARSEKPKAKFVLQARPRHGFQPLDVTLYARLEDVPEGEDSFCHAGLEWIGETRSGRVMRSTEDARCIHPADVKRVDHSYTKTLHVSRPAIYRYHAVLHLKDGSVLRSNVVEVRVISTR